MILHHIKYYSYPMTQAMFILACTDKHRPYFFYRKLDGLAILVKAKNFEWVCRNKHAEHALIIDTLITGGLVQFATRRATSQGVDAFWRNVADMPERPQQIVRLRLDNITFPELTKHTPIGGTNQMLEHRIKLTKPTVTDNKPDSSDHDDTTAEDRAWFIVLRVYLATIVLTSPIVIVYAPKDLTPYLIASHFVVVVLLLLKATRTTTKVIGYIKSRLCR